MKIWQLDPFVIIFDIFKPQRICEIGTHHARSACQFVQYLCPRVEHVHYTGYDLFEDADAAITRAEHNGKGPGSYYRANRSLAKMKQLYPNLSFELIRGNTSNTMQPQTYDFVYIDGGHSYATVMHDFSMVRGSKVLVFDDCQILGVQQAVKEIQETNPEYYCVPLPVRHERLKRKQTAMFYRPTDLIISRLRSEFGVDNAVNNTVKS